jgi:hypothetical protein
MQIETFGRFLLGDEKNMEFLVTNGREECLGKKIQSNGF